MAVAGDEEAQKRVKTRWVVRGGVASLAIPGPEDYALAAFAATKAGRFVTRFADEAAGFVKGLFRSGDEISDITSGVSKSVHSGRQGKHIRGHNNFEEGKK